MPVKMTHERPGRARPLGRHAVARQVARHQVQQAGHRRRAGEPEDRDRADVVDACRSRCRGARAPGTRARGRRPGRRAGTPPPESARVVTKLLPISITLMISAAVASSFFVLRIRPSGAPSVSVGVAATSGMTATPVSNPDSPSASFGKQQQRHRQPSSADRRAARTAPPSSRASSSGCCQISRRPIDDDDDVEREVDDDQHDRDADRLAEALAGRRAPSRAAAASVTSSG